jgi:ABC-2 type transport system permease protein
VIATVIRRELLLQRREGRLVLTAAVLLAAMIAAVLVGWTQYTQAEQARAEFAAEARSQWLNQGERHPHRAAHFGVYVAKPELSLALFEPGLRPFAGQTLWLEAHDRPAFSNIPSEDDLTLGVGLGVASGSAILQMLGGLIVLIMGALAIVRERESGVLRQVLAQGVLPRDWVAGKFLGLALTFVAPLLDAGLLATAGAALLLSPAGERMDTLLRALLLIGANGLLLLALLAVALTISALSRSSRGALLIALGIWLAGFVLGPRLASTLAVNFAPAPTLTAYQQAVSERFSAGVDERGGYDQQLAMLQAEMLERYGVDTLAQLPVGFSGLRMMHLDAWSTEVDDIEYANLGAVYSRQGAVRTVVALFAPFIAARGVSQGMAGMDWPHYQHFLDAAEDYRRGFAHQMNSLLERRVTGDRWEIDGDNEDWATVDPFEYAFPAVGWAVRAQAPFLWVLLLWAAGSAGLLMLTVRKLRP